MRSNEKEPLDEKTTALIIEKLDKDLSKLELISALN